jgi:competence protein ComEA
MVVWALAAGAIVFAGARMLGGRSAQPPAIRVDGKEGAGAGDAPSGAVVDRHGEGEGGLYVHVAGAVRHPGLLRVPAGARVAVAIDRAGGAVRGADLTAVNLAQPLEDGQQVIVPGRMGQGAPGAGNAGATAAGAPPSLGTATLEQLEGLDGIGPALAQRIVEYREAHGGFRSLEELREVDGIGDKRFAALKKALRP